MERQWHGLAFEDYVRKEYGILPCPEGHYTYKWDGLFDGHPVSIKVEKLGSDIELASFKRNAENLEDFYLIVGFWSGDKTNIVDIQVLYIIGEEWHRLFDIDIVNQCENLINNITNNPSDDEKWSAERKRLTALWKKNTSNLVRPRFKRDHKTQKRMQCAINNKDFYNYFIPKYSWKER